MVMGCDGIMEGDEMYNGWLKSKSSDTGHNKITGVNTGGYTQQPVYNINASALIQPDKATKPSRTDNR
jgi:hypothetical protein